MLLFQRYYYYKKEDPIWALTNRAFPYGTTIMFEDIVLNLDPDMRLYENFERATEKLKKIERRLVERFNAQMKAKGYIEPMLVFKDELPTIPEWPGNLFSYMCMFSGVSY